MKNRSLKIAENMNINETYYDGLKERFVTMDYIEKSHDHWHQDSEISIDISEDKAKDIILFLSDAFDLSVDDL